MISWPMESTRFSGTECSWELLFYHKQKLKGFLPCSLLFWKIICWSFVYNNLNEIVLKMYANWKPRKHPNALSIASLQSLIRPIIIFHKKLEMHVIWKSDKIDKDLKITRNYIKKKRSRQVPYFATALLRTFLIKYHVLVKWQCTGEKWFSRTGHRLVQLIYI